MKKTLTYSEYLQALALFTVSRKHYAKSREMEFELGELLESDDPGYVECVSDAIYNEGDFDEALKKHNIVIEPRPDRISQ